MNFYNQNFVQNQSLNYNNNNNFLSYSGNSGQFRNNNVSFFHPLLNTSVREHQYLLQNFNLRDQFIKTNQLLERQPPPKLIHPVPERWCQNQQQQQYQNVYTEYRCPQDYKLQQCNKSTTNNADSQKLQKYRPRDLVAEKIKDLKNIRSTSIFEKINGLNYPYGTSFKPYQILDGFQFAQPRKVNLYENSKTISSDELLKIRKDFELNGVDEAEDYTSQSQCAGECSTMEQQIDPLHQIWNVNKNEISLQPQLQPNLIQHYQLLPNVCYRAGDRLNSQQKCCQQNGAVPYNVNVTMFCSFCQNNGQSKDMYTSHDLKDSKKKVLCPVLRSYQCPICGASGDNGKNLQTVKISNIIFINYFDSSHNSILPK